ncbi:hypothetical protein O3M35_002574 [Rhynocoris fuscipes]|uniref:Odorant receptor n=1 Tax=Rhynocoris fuscipes TaxID=488301 RepID=A0AAW1CP99_9HEMI
MFYSIKFNFVELAVGSREIQDIVGTLSTFVTIACGTLRAIRFFTRKKVIINLLNRLEAIRLKMLSDEESKRYVIDAENIGRKILTLIFISLNGFPIPALLWVTFCNFLHNFEEKLLIHKVWIPWDPDNVWKNILANMFQALMSVPCLAFFVGVHCVDISFTLYVSAYIKTLQNKLINKGIKNEEIYEQHNVIIQLIMDHNELLSGIKYLEAQTSPLMPCGFGYIFIRAINKNEITKAIDFYFRAMLGFLPPIISCCSGQFIITQKVGIRPINKVRLNEKFSRFALDIAVSTLNEA